MARNLQTIFEARPHDFRVARYRNGWTLRDLAEVAGVHYDTAKAAERGLVPSFESQRRLAEALGAHPDDFWPLADDAADAA